MGAARLPVVYVITGEEDEGLNCVEIPAPGPRVAVADLLAHLPAPPPACDWFLSLAGGRFLGGNDAVDAPRDGVVRLVLTAVAAAPRAAAPPAAPRTPAAAARPSRAAPPGAPAERTPAARSPGDAPLSSLFARGLSAAKTTAAAAARAVDGLADAAISSGAMGSAVRCGDRRLWLGKALRVADGGRRTTYAVRDVDEGAEFSLLVHACGDKVALRAVKREVELLQKLGGCRNVAPLLAQSVLHRSASAADGSLEGGSRLEVAVLQPPYAQTVADTLEAFGAARRRRLETPALRRGDLRNPWTEPRLARLLVGVARGLGHMHAADVAHGDVCPHAVALGRDGAPLLIHLKHARSPARAPTATNEDRVFLASSLADVDRGCVAPECRGPVREGAVVDARADVYAFGALAFATAFGAPPRRGRAVDFPPRREHAGVQFSDALAAVVRRAMTFDVAERPSVAELMRELRALG